ncbi:PD40 domain-containing protein [Streptomyces sp. ISL-12]|uniref:PD40 domain-containing protein n=1 Tax=Streptomyces sp. ISL-12 TaxID=2819177 RepID=UPI001BE67C92|nr:PD40 domain-containing protein [Streptomyces sp. ISL-12]MBT2411169.1 PD40 domain-containing protein [Streptomyces sp. ISL-12]
MRSRWGTAVAALTVAAAASVAVLPAPATAHTAPSHGRHGHHPKTHNVRLTQGADAESEAPSLSADGRYAVFVSEASSLVRGDTNGVADVFLRDLRTGRTQRVSTDAEGRQSAHGATYGAISAGGRHVVFISAAPDLIPGETHDKRSVYWRDLRTGKLRYAGNEITGNTAHARDASVSADGRYVAYESSDAVPKPGRGVAVRDMRTGELTIHPYLGVLSYGPSLSDDGRVLVYTNGQYYRPFNDVKVADARTGEYRSAYLTPEGVRGNGDVHDGRISGDGRYVSFSSAATDLGPEDANGAGYNVFVRDLRTGSLRIVEAPDPSLWTLDGRLSRDGRYLLFRAATNWSDGSWYLRDLRTGRTTPAVTDASGRPAEALVGDQPLDSRAGTVAFSSEAGHMARGPRSAGADAYVRRIR